MQLVFFSNIKISATSQMYDPFVLIEITKCKDIIDLKTSVVYKYHCFDLALYCYLDLIALFIYDILCSK